MKETEESRKEEVAAGKRRATLCMYGFVGDFKLKLANDHNDDDDDAAHTREAVVQG